MNDIYKKYNMKFEGKRRYYVEDLSKRDYILENTTPFRIRINDFFIEDSSWGGLILGIVSHLYEMNPIDVEDLINYRTDWSKAAMFSKENRTNFRRIKDDLYVNCNHTALHSCWFIQDLLSLFGIDISNVELIIHRPPSSEPEEIKLAIETKVKKDFKNYLRLQYDKDDETSYRIISNISDKMNPKLSEISKSYPNFFLFDDYTTYYNYAAKFLERISQSLNIPEKNKRIYQRYISYLTSFYKELGY